MQTNISTKALHLSSILAHLILSQQLGFAATADLQRSMVVAVGTLGSICLDMKGMSLHLFVQILNEGIR